MKPWVRSKIPLLPLLFVLAVGLLFLGAAGLLKVQGEHPAISQQMESAALMSSCLDAIRLRRLELGIPLDVELDPNQTGLIGEGLTEITTSLGNLEAKRTGTNPEFSALLVRYFHELGLKPGDYLAIGASGSFPGLILACLTAAEVLELEPLLIYSIGSSTYGANIPQFTFLEMLAVLNARGLLSSQPLAISFGGDRDLAENPLLDGATEVFERIASAYDFPLISETDLAGSMAKRKELYFLAGGAALPACFVNVGGASANYGTTNASLHFPNGLVRQAPQAAEHPEVGLIYEYAREGVPVIHLLDIRDLALKNGLPIDPVPFPTLGTGLVFFEMRYRNALLYFALLLLPLLLSAFRLNAFQRKELVKEI